MAVRPHLGSVLLAVAALVIGGVVIGRVTAVSGSSDGTTSPIVINPVSNQSADDPTPDSAIDEDASTNTPVATPDQPTGGDSDEPYTKVTQKPRAIETSDNSGSEPDEADDEADDDSGETSGTDDGSPSD